MPAGPRSTMPPGRWVGRHAQPGGGLGTGLGAADEGGPGRLQAGDAALVQRLRLRVR